MSKEVKRSNPKKETTSRRSFLKTAAVVAGCTAGALGFPNVLRLQAQGTINWKGQNAYMPVPNAGPFQRSMHGAGNNPLVFAKWLNRETNGQLQINVAPPGAVVPVSQIFNAVSKGALDFGGEYYSGFHAGIMPEADIETGLPFGWETVEETYDAYFNRGLLQEVKAAYAEHNIYWVPHINPTRYGFGTTFPCPNPETIKGKKIRALGIYGELVRQLGGSPVVIPGVRCIWP